MTRTQNSFTAPVSTARSASTTFSNKPTSNEPPHTPPPQAQSSRKRGGSQASNVVRSYPNKTVHGELSSSLSKLSSSPPYFHASIPLCIHAYTWAYTPPFLHTSMLPCLHVGIHACTPPCLHTSMHPYLHVGIHSD